MHAVEVQRQLAEALLQQANAFVALADARALQGEGQLLHFFGEQGCAVKLDHQQTAMDLMDAFQALADGLAAAFFNIGVQRRTGLFQGFGNFALDPFEGHVVVPINHNRSRLNSFVAL